MPLPRRFDNGFQIAVNWIPAKLLFGLFGGSHQYRRVSSTARRNISLDVDAGHLSGYVDYFLYRKAFAVASIVDRAGIVPLQLFNGSDMGVGKIGHMNVIADTAPVRRVIVVAIYLNMVPLTQRGL